MASITAHCPACGHTDSYPAHMRRKRTKCVACDEPFRIIADIDDRLQTGDTADTTFRTHLPPFIVGIAFFGFLMLAKLGIIQRWFAEKPRNPNVFVHVQKDGEPVPDWVKLMPEPFMEPIKPRNIPPVQQPPAAKPEAEAVDKTIERFLKLDRPKVTIPPVAQRQPQVDPEPQPPPAVKEPPPPRPQVDQPAPAPLPPPELESKRTPLPGPQPLLPTAPPERAQRPIPPPPVVRVPTQVKPTPVPWKVTPEASEEIFTVRLNRPIHLVSGLNDKLLFPATASRFMAYGNALIPQNRLHVYDLADQREVGVVPGTVNWLKLLALSPDGRYVAGQSTGAVDGHVETVSVATGQKLGRYTPTRPERISWVEFGPRPEELLVAVVDRENPRIDTVSVTTGKTLRSITMASLSTVRTPIAPSPRRNYLAVADQKQTIEIYACADGRRCGVLAVPPNLNRATCAGLAWSSDGKTIAGLYHEFGKVMTLVCWDAGTGERSHHHTLTLENRNWLDAGQSPPCWLPDGQHLLIAGTDVVDTRTGHVQVRYVSEQRVPKIARRFFPPLVMVSLDGPPGRQSVQITPIDPVTWQPTTGNQPAP